MGRMKPSMLLLLFFFGRTNLFGQLSDIYQPASVYKQSGVKSRVLMYDRARWKSRAMADFFDHEGRVVEHIEYDSTGSKYKLKEVLKYDSVDRIVFDVLYVYELYDTILRRLNISEMPDTISIQNEYDSLNRLYKQERFKSGKVFLTAVYEYGPLVKKQKNFSNDTLIFESTIFYDKPYIENKTISTHYNKDGSVFKTTTFIFKNKFDKTRKIRWRKVACDEIDNDNPDEEFYYKNIDYQYTPYGLLINRTSSNRSDKKNWGVGLLFDYKFW